VKRLSFKANFILKGITGNVNTSKRVGATKLRRSKGRCGIGSRTAMISWLAPVWLFLALPTSGIIRLSNQRPIMDLRPFLVLRPFFGLATWIKK